MLSIILHHFAIVKTWSKTQDPQHPSFGSSQLCSPLCSSCTPPLRTQSFVLESTSKFQLGNVITFEKLSRSHCNCHLLNNIIPNPASHLMFSYFFKVTKNSSNGPSQSSSDRTITAERKLMRLWTLNSDNRCDATWIMSCNGWGWSHCLIWPNCKLSPIMETRKC